MHIHMPQQSGLQKCISGRRYHRGDVLIVDDDRFVQCVACVKVEDGHESAAGLLVNEAIKRKGTWKVMCHLQAQTQFLVLSHHRIRFASFFKQEEQRLYVIL